MHIQQIVRPPTQRPTPRRRPVWLENADKHFGELARQIDRSGSIKVMDQFGRTCYRMMTYLQDPNSHRARSVKDAISALDATRSDVGLKDCQLPIVLWNIKRAANQEIIRVAVEVLKPEIQRIFRFRIHGQD